MKQNELTKPWIPFSDSWDHCCGRPFDSPLSSHTLVESLFASILPGAFSENNSGVIQGFSSRLHGAFSPLHHISTSLFGLPVGAGRLQHDYRLRKLTDKYFLEVLGSFHTVCVCVFFKYIMFLWERVFRQTNLHYPSTVHKMFLKNCCSTLQCNIHWTLYLLYDVCTASII